VGPFRACGTDLTVADCKVRMGLQLFIQKLMNAVEEGRMLNSVTLKMPVNILGGYLRYKQVSLPVSSRAKVRYNVSVGGKIRRSLVRIRGKLKWIALLTFSFVSSVSVS
jgi:hypothetical protein